MIKALKNLFRKRSENDLSKYSGMADFFLHAPEELKKKVMMEAAKKANEDQMKIFKEAELKIKTN
jgi:hypothetical protein